MFQSLNLFKSSNCPFYSPASNTLSCERPYCLFRHPNLQQVNHEIIVTAPLQVTNLPQSSNTLTTPTNTLQNLNSLDLNSKSLMHLNFIFNKIIILLLN